MFPDERDGGGFARCGGGGNGMMNVWVLGKTRVDSENQD
jgi:hypothetical protein